MNLRVFEPVSPQGNTFGLIEMQPCLSRGSSKQLHSKEHQINCSALFFAAQRDT